LRIVAAVADIESQSSNARTEARCTSKRINRERTTGMSVQPHEQFAPRFVGEVVTKWLRHDGDDRLMQLREDFTFVESPEYVWTAPAGFIVDGTTIPRALWTLFGDPFIGDYRRAAVTHDLLCTPICAQCHALMADRGPRNTPRYICGKHPLIRPRYRTSSDQAARTMYAAMRTDGVTETRARAIERAVRQWGPQFVAG
jgi:Protein of unknown function (DUF1353)